MRTTKLNPLLGAIAFFLSVNVLASDNLVKFDSDFDTTSLPKSEQVRLIPGHTFIPPGFDNYNNVQLILSGELPNTCYKAGGTSYKIDIEAKKIFVSLTAYVFSGTWCLPVVSPYMHVVNLGLLPAGQYQVMLFDRQGTPRPQGTLNVALSHKSTPDDYLYAPVSDVLVERGEGSGNANLIIKGQFSTNCMHLEEVRVLYRTPNIIEVLPISSLETKPGCRNVKTPFESKVALKSTWTGETLVYVRSLNGQAVSKIEEF